MININEISRNYFSGHGGHSGAPPVKVIKVIDGGT